MQITQIELKNVKSYEECGPISFSRGVNAICGPNGAGKSTLIEAIGLALFDYPAMPQSQFVRDGSGRGEIVVTFEDVLDEREYQVVRPVNAGGPYIYDPEIKRQIVTGKQDVIDWLKEHLGVDPTVDLTALFVDAIGVPQGLLTAPFLETPANRKDKFDPLLQVDEYETSWEELRKTESYLRDRISEQEVLISQLQTKLERLPQVKEQIHGIHTEIKEDEDTLGEIETELTEVNHQKENLDQAKERVDAAELEFEKVKGKVEALVDRIGDVQEAVEAAEEAQQIVTDAEPGYQAYEAAKSRLDELEKDRQARDKVQEQLNQVEKDLASVSQQVVNAEETLKKIAEAESRLATIAPLVRQQAQLEKDLKEAERDADRLELEQSRLAEAQERLDKLNEGLVQLKAGLKRRRQMVEEIGELEIQREAHDKELETLGEKLAEQEKALSEADEKLRKAEETVRELERTQEQLAREQQRLDGLRAQLVQVRTDLKERQKLEAMLAELDETRRQLDKELHKVEKDAAVTENRIDALDERLNVLKQVDAAQCPVCREPLTPERAEELITDYEVERKELKAQLEELRQQSTSLQNRLKANTFDHEEVQTHLKPLPSPEREADLLRDVQAQEQEVEAWQEEARQLAEAPEKVVEAKEVKDRLAARVQSVREDRDAASQAQAELDKQLNVLQEQILELPRPQREQELSAEIEMQQERLAEQQTSVDALRDAPDQVAGLEAKLDDLGDPRAERQSLMGTIAERANIQESLENAQEKEVKFSTKKEELEEALSAYASLNETMETQRTRLNEHEAAHQRYLRNIETAQAIDERQSRLSELQEDRGELQKKQAVKRQELDLAQEAYDAENHEEIIGKQKQLEQNRATLSGRLSEKRDQLAELESEREVLVPLQGELVSAEEEQSTLKSLAGHAGFVRQTIRDARPAVTRALVRLISAQADRVFGDIMDDHTMHLRWAEDYGIKLEQSGTEREFSQLSGGEKMAAALAVRLALLQEMSGIRVAFLDEPTAHLDDARRDNLAEQITRITNFNQLFVISHDDTFERDTHHVLRVIKENGTSRVEVG